MELTSKSEIRKFHENGSNLQKKTLNLMEFKQSKNEYLRGIDKNQEIEKGKSKYKSIQS